VSVRVTDIDNDSKLRRCNDMQPMPPALRSFRNKVKLFSLILKAAYRIGR
jgi:hypothetical protein